MSKPLWTAREAHEATGSQAAGEWQANSVSIDSRSIAPGGLFVAIVGERVDGHQYVKQAIDAGAAAAIVDRPIEGVAADQLVVVDDTTKALEALGIYARKRTDAKIIGVTGSVGKTTTKEALRLMCEAFGGTFASQGNFNNHFGAPLSLANMPANTEFGVFEMGMNHAGEISKLTEMVRPHIAIITTVEAVHLEFFDDEQGIARAKAEIFDGLEPGGAAILNADSEHTDFIRTLLLHEKRSEQVGERAISVRSTVSCESQETFTETNINIITFGEENNADVKKVTSALTDQGSRLTVEVGGQSLELELTTSNIAVDAAILVSLATAKALGLELEKAVNQLQQFTEVKGRGQVEPTELDGKAMWWMDDSYNASPASMRAAFGKLATVKTQQSAERTVAVLGDMLELGDQSAALHQGLAASIAEHHIDCVYTTGELMQHLHEAVSPSIHTYHAPDLAKLQEVLKDQLRSGDVVLFKGSNGSKIHQLVKDLLGKK